MSYRLLAMAGVLALSMRLGAQGATLHVYAGGSIQAAIDSAVAKDVILVHPGTYPERIDFHGTLVLLRSTDGPAATTLDGQHGGTVVTCSSGEGPDTLLEGFTIINGQGTQGGGMGLFGASPTVRNCILRDNQAQYGAGIFVSSGHPLLEQCTFEHNVASASAGGMYNYSENPSLVAATVQDCRFTNNHAESSGGAMRNWDTSPTVTGCSFEGNTARYSGAGMANGGASNPNVTDCIFDGNRTDSLFSPNWDAYGGAMSNSETSSPVLVNCVMVDNLVVALYPRLARGGALANTGSAQPTLINCTLRANLADIGNALSNSGTSHVTVRSSILWNGSGEIANEGSATVSITYSDTADTWPGTGNLSLDPRFTGARLQSDSPCINAGDPSYSPAGGRDLDGHARVLCTRVDMGAYEFGIGDYDCDRDVDAEDFVGGASCMTGPENGPYDAGCEALDFEYDQDVDLADLAVFQAIL